MESSTWPGPDADAETGAGAGSDPVRVRVAAAAESFSLIRGEPLDRLWRALGLGSAGEGHSHARARALLLAALCWLPMAILAAAQSVVLGPGRDSFAHDVGTHVRCLLALPLLILAEHPLDAAFREGVGRLANHGLVAREDLAAYEEILTRTERAKRSLGPTLALLGIVAIRSTHVANVLLAGTTPTWMTPVPAAHTLSLAAVWQFGVALPIWGFLLLNWCWRWSLWCSLLLQVSRLRLRLLGAHPDRTGALGFLDEAAGAFSTVVLAGAAVVSGQWIQRVAYHGADVRAFAMPLLGLVLGVFAVVLGPMVIFIPRLYWLRMDDTERYDRLAQRYQRAFDRAWLTPNGPAGDTLLRDLDAQTLADLTSVAGNVQRMRIVPFGKEAAMRLLLAIAVPMVPLVLTVVPTKEILIKLVNALL